ncbi:hypothetical protein EXU57_23230 [Segetibacter sp. 3557_3]|uniref:hypothetical protein n=1 Tax=Segetibacter sp. 3557_3 TaxID=2547429 RepID=UPI001058FE54|nr:hypothetical protein [Segetibacter sp. 3557_3]TDH18513.1 hypothetical protein EXU57_23230 [Segetibacter sp. 3557_3]
MLVTPTGFLNDPANSVLWTKIQQFNFDEPGSQIRFVDKLASKNNWSAAYAERVIEEYRKFIFLCCISPTGASPSQAVDEAWHLHLTYTRSYWINLCKNTLGIDLHHNPSKGGEQEYVRHQQWYKDTLAFYEQAFGTVPPGDIWPGTNNVVTPTEMESKSRGLWKELVALSVLCLPFLFISQAYDIVFPFDLYGGQFLVFYLLLCIAAAIAFIMVYKPKADRVRSAVRNHFPENISVFEAAECLHGNEWVLRTAIVDLVSRGVIEVQDSKKIRISRADFLPEDNNPLVTLCQQNEGRELSYHDIRSEWKQSGTPASSTLNKVYDVASKEIAVREPLDKVYLPLAIIGIGLIRVIQGIVNDRPIYFLLLEIIGFLLMMLVIYKDCSWFYAFEDELKNLCLDKINLSRKPQDEVVTNFAVTGNVAISAFGQAALLSSIFLLSTTAEGACGGGAADGGGVDGGGGCGSGCGGGGCGGCGGG